MSSSIPSFSPWRRRSSSINSHPTSRHRDGTDSIDAAHGSDHHPTSPRHLSTSLSSGPGHREPIRSFIHGSVREDLAPISGVENARSVRKDTAELATYLLSDGTSQRSASFLQRSRPAARDIFRHDSDDSDSDHHRVATSAIPEIAIGPPSGDDAGDTAPAGPSILSNLFKKTPSEPVSQDVSARDSEPSNGVPVSSPSMETPRRETVKNGQATEHTPLLGTHTPSDTSYGDSIDLERQKNYGAKGFLGKLRNGGRRIEEWASSTVVVAADPRRWNAHSVWRNVLLPPVACLPAVTVGLLLNILDALSYGMILFPLSQPIFSHLGPAGISIFYVSTIVSQFTFSSGSIFKGAVGSELIEVVPFFHNMAQKITDTVGADKPDAVIATTIVAYATSSMMTGLVFYLMGRFKFGFMVGFIPRHILIGCIGGVGWFLIATGFEVSARLESNLEYDLDTLQKLTRPETVPLWLSPLVLAIVLFYGQAKVPSKYFLPLYILGIPVIFYFFVLALDVLDIDTLRDHGWIFTGPPAGEPWWYFYTLYKLRLVRWDAIIECIPAMLALTFFGILHVPINVPALALNCGEDNANLDSELKLHGYSNFLSGCLGSIQNYLVYSNTIFFMRSGGDTRLAGYMLAACTFGVMCIGPSLIGFIPVMMVGTLIFDLGFELLLEAVWLPRKKLKLAEYMTVLVIVLVMGTYDFVIGIGIGIILAFVSLVVQTSRVSTIRATFNGDIVTSTVRRNPSQHHYLQQVGQQIYIMKLTGFLFFGTVVGVEQKIRDLLEDNAFSKQPIRYLILDLWHVNGLDYSAGEAFNTISRLLDKKGVVLVLSGVDPERPLGANLRAVGLGCGSIEVLMLPDLNSALESCENELLKTLYARQEERNEPERQRSAGLDVPGANSSAVPSLDLPSNSPRRSRLFEAAQAALVSVEVQRPSRWKTFREPLRLMLQIFQGVSDKNEDFWFPATAYFKRKEYPVGTVLFRRGESADGFYLIERGIIRAEYDFPQGWLCESIVAGTTCGELPFFSETNRTATATVEKDCVVWLMDCEGWEKLQKDEPEIAKELLRISLKLTSERMSAFTSYILSMAG
ncbi:sulfate transporter family-domain-containing protein [Stachybotrys elegans]|uniref:Sulfate transporter family-domain-containing protein n=1 Tax=Stachybotrys elegans TaxID=80388 RepID=A0A8K0WWH4_9HYPO|nr:sulfate transporter family-domain-containing protein [Stachybotrys elegans]